MPTDYDPEREARDLINVLIRCPRTSTNFYAGSVALRRAYAAGFAAGQEDMREKCAGLFDADAGELESRVMNEFAHEDDVWEFENSLSHARCIRALPITPEPKEMI